MSQEHNFWIQIFLKDSSDLVGLKWWLQLESPLPKSCAKHWKASDGNVHQYLFHQNPAEKSCRVSCPSLFTGWHGSIRSLVCSLLWWWWKTELESYVVPCVILQSLLTILCVSCDSRGEHCFANGITLMNSGTGALQNKKSQFVNLWLWPHLSLDSNSLTVGSHL